LQKVQSPATPQHVHRLVAGKWLAGTLLIAGMLTSACCTEALQATDNPEPIPQAGSSEPHPKTRGSVNIGQDDLPKLEAIENEIRDARYLEVEPVLRQYLDEHPTSWRAHYDLGYVLFRARGGGQPLADALSDSIKELSRSLVLNIDDADAHKILGLDFTMILRDDLAEVEFKQAVRLDPNSAEIHYFLGRHYMGQSTYDLARAELETAIRLDPAYMKAYDNLGITMDMLGDRPAALRNYLNAIELDEKQGSASELPYLDLAKFYHEQNDLANAESFAKKALDKNPRSDLACYELARIDYDQSRWKKAVDVLQQAIALDPYSKEYYYLLGRTYQKLGNLEESKQAFDNYVKYQALSEKLGAAPTD
jgi:tetratricopeptide (TPR) repeat protein